MDSQNSESSEARQPELHPDLQHAMILLGVKEPGDLHNAIVKLKWQASHAVVAQKLIHGAAEEMAQATNQLLVHRDRLDDQAKKSLHEIRDLMVPQQPPSDASGPQIVSIEPAENCEAELFAMLRQCPPLMAQLYETLKTGRWLVTMHARVKDCTPDDLISHHTMKDFPTDEVVTVMQGHCRHILAEESRRLQRLDGQAAATPRWR